MEQSRVPKIFICYRRDDASESAGRLYETLTRRFGTRHVFWDYNTIPGGAVFDSVIQDAIKSSGILLAVIGRDWLTLTEGNKRRLDDANDYVRLEIATALEQGIRVIPVLVEGASLPHVDDLPEELRKLVERQVITISPQTWRDDAKKLIKSIQKDFERNYPYSILFGAIAGLLAGVAFGFYYWHLEPAISPWRLLLNGFYGLVAGTIFSGLINYGIARCSRILRWAPSANIVGGVLGGAAAGVLASIVGGATFVRMNEQPVGPIPVAIAVAGSTVFIALGILVPELKEAWYKRLVTLLVLACALYGTLSLTLWVFAEKLPDLQEQFESPFSKGVLILGLVCGIMSGMQVGLALWAYERFPKLDRN